LSSLILTLTEVKGNSLNLKLSAEACEIDYSQIDYVEGYWKLNETSGTTFQDDWDAVNGLLYFTTGDWVNGKLANGVYLDGINDWAYIGNPNSFTFDEIVPFAVEFWFWSNETNIGATAIIGKHSNVYNRGWGLYTVFGIPIFALTDRTANHFISGNTSLYTSSWNHIVLTYDGSDTPAGLEIYVNAQETKNSENTAGTITNLNSDTPFSLGWYAGNALLNCEGIWDNLILYNTILSKAEVIYQYNNSNGKEYYPDRQVPTVVNLTEVSDPLEFGLNESITFDACDENNVSSVLIEIDGANYTMNNIAGNTWNYNNWNPIISGIHAYKIWLTDEFDNIGSYSNSITVLNTPELIITSAVFGVLFAFMFVFYLYKREFLIMLVIFSFSLVIGAISLTQYLFPFYPFIQLFFITIQGVFFILSALEYNRIKKFKRYA
jgi:hypothetical protein